MGSQDLKTMWKKVWYFLWEDDSIWSWIVNFVLAFILIKYLIYPGLGWILGTPFPIVAVISGSMEHAYAPETDARGDYPLDEQGNVVYRLCNDSYAQEYRTINLKRRVSFEEFWEACGAWYDANGVSAAQFQQFPFRQGFNRGDIMVLIGRKPEKLGIGDVIVFSSPIRAEPIIHRVVAVHDEESGLLFQTKGDHNPQTYPFEQYIPPKVIYGKAVFRIPWLGYVKIIAVDLWRLVTG